MTAVLQRQSALRGTAAASGRCAYRWNVLRSPADGTRCRAAAVETTSSTADVQLAKQQLYDAIAYTRRGAAATSHIRGQIEEAQVGVENFADAELNYDLLEGTWKLIYTTALDVLPIIDLEQVLQTPVGISPIEVGEIYQRFSSPEKGWVENIIKLSVPFLLESRQGVTFTVGASYEVMSPHRIALTFRQAEVGQVKISEGLEALLAPAVLPRGFPNMQLLQGIKDFKLNFQFQTAQQTIQGRNVGANYILTYLDDDMLIGRASGLAGSFVFSRAQGL